ncbi:hypothetical protein O7635_13455 [Asanoa sp. WMMD1127]|uniref:hypothetical protein n=1 Tax=Asanoa sp. WMMD1127 TaxID=3016107 RepID=UPI00241657E8|nr:hypothetical protein [Asanoa sp. WMMD1127]MDG4822856.1 hypothetical protein [Asanoa sp. WMMD1127]
MTVYFSIMLVLVLGSGSYAAGRLHGRVGYRTGYRQGFFDGDRGAVHRRRREVRAVDGTNRAGPRQRSASDAPTTRIGSGTTYLSASFVETTTDGGRHSAGARVIASQPAG